MGGRTHARTQLATARAGAVQQLAGEALGVAALVFVGAVAHATVIKRGAAAAHARAVLH